MSILIKCILGIGRAIADEMVGWHHRLKGHEFEQTLGDSEGQGSLVSCSSLGHKEFRLEWATEQQTLEI